MRKINIIVVLLLSCILLNAETETITQSVVEQNVQEVEKVEKNVAFKLKSKEALINLLKMKKTPSNLSKNLTKKYYRNHKYMPFWTNQEGIKQIAYSLISTIKNDPVLEPSSKKLFNLENINLQIENIEAQSEDILQLMTLDIMLTSTYHKYMQYLSRGFIDWKAFQKELKTLNEKKKIVANWNNYSVRKNIRKLLYKAVDEDDISIAINEVNFTFPKAKQLSERIEEFEEISKNGGYVKVPAVKKSLKKDHYYPQIKEIRERLLQSKDLVENKCISENSEEKQNNIFKKETQVTTKNIDELTATVEIKKVEIKPKQDCLELYDENVFQAVKSFQKNHGLVQDGVVGRNTIKRLNIPIEKKIEKMRINLERMRWMPRSLGEEYVVVNIPDYKLKMYDKGEIKLDMAVIVGNTKNPTPIFSHKMSSIVLNPYWRIPQSIVKKELIPKLVENPNYLSTSDIKVFENWSHKSTQYDTKGIDWSVFLDNDLIGSSKEAPMRFIQIPGDSNPLGRMKFMFPNRYSVYLHDTPYKGLFKNNRRAYSHGCIRLSRPQDLLKTITQEDSRLNYDKAKKILSEKEKTDLDLSKEIPVHIIYLTSWLDENGKVQFRDDIYKFDKLQRKFLYNQSL